MSRRSPRGRPRYRPSAGPGTTGRTLDPCRSGRRLPAAPDVRQVNGGFEITHPFHPLRGRTFVAQDERWSWGKRWLYCFDDEGRLFCVPAQWTNVGDEDPFVAVSGGRAHARVEDLLRLVELVERVRR